MATQGGREGHSLNQELIQAPYRFDFFQAVRLLEHRHRERARRGASPDRTPVGQDDPDREVVHFRAHSSLSFPGGAISQVHDVAAADPDRDPPPPELIVTFLGLTGPSGVLPRHYTTLLLQRIRSRDHAFRDFLDLFHHRLIALFYRAWEKYRLPVNFERCRLDDPSGPPDPATAALHCLVGLGTDGLRGRLDVVDDVFLYFSGHFAHFPRSAVALECLLEEFLEMPTRVQQLHGQWLELDADAQSRMPSALEPKGRNNSLGIDLVVGERVWDVQSKFRLRLGPLRWPQFRSLMPNGTALRPLCQLTRAFVGPELDFDVQPILHPNEVPPCRLPGPEEDGPYLGWNTWLRTEPLSRQVDDAVFLLADT
jgi:type VI secretion system protein ImpH